MSDQAAEPQVFEVPRKGPDGQDRGTVSVSAEPIDKRIRYRLLKDAVVMYGANRRRGTHDTRTRADVTGSGKKPWRQKGTGHARSGTRKSPVWRGGGVVFGPHPRDYTIGINKKQRRLALRSALFAKFQAGDVCVLEGLDLPEPRTRDVAAALTALGVEGRCLIGTVGVDRNLVLSSRNLRGVQVLPVADFNALEVLRAGTILLTPAALEALQSGAPAEGAPAEGAPADGGGASASTTETATVETEGGDA